MKPISIREAADAAGGRILRQGQKLEISGVSTDSRTIKPGDLFAALEGEKYDGHDFGRCSSKGAAALLISNTDKPLPENVGIIVVDDTLTALQDLAAWYLKKFRLMWWQLPAVPENNHQGYDCQCAFQKIQCA